MPKHIAKIFLILAAFLLLPDFVFGAPSITSAPSSVSDGQSITISGNGFGTMGPNIIVFDEFEKGISGNAISTLSDSATMNQWDELSNFGQGTPRYSTDYSHSGTKCLKNDWTEGGASEPSDRLRAYLDRSGTAPSEVYLQYWWFIPMGGDVPGANTVAGGNWKMFTVYEGTLWSYATSYTSVIMGDAATYWPYGGWGFIVLEPWEYPSSRHYLQSSQGGYHDFGYGSLNCQLGVWMRMEYYLNASSTDNGALGVWQMNSIQPRAEIGYASGVQTTSDGNVFRRLQFPGYARGDGTTYLDDIYISTGPGAQSRVEIGNAPIYSECTNLATITPTSWSDSSISATVKQGSFSDGTAYIFVVDENGESSAGYPITIGGELDITAPNSPSGLSVS